MPRAYDAIISLGGACKPAFNIRRHFGNDRAFPFDWWITTRRGIERVIRNDFHGVYRPENMRVSRDRMSVFDAALEVHYHHDFSETIGGPVAANFVERIPERLQCFTALAARMTAICATGSVLFIRHEHKDHPGWDDSAPATIGRAESWLAMFREKWPAGHADLLLLDSGPQIPEPFESTVGCAFFDNIDAVPGDGPWQPRGYDRMFSRYDFVSVAPPTSSRRLTPGDDDVMR